jgi:hypothetical protein
VTKYAFDRQLGEDGLSVRRLIETSTYEPETLHVVFQAFDEAWGEIAHHFTGDEMAAENARGWRRRF